jgi:NAD(P)-dependent dehydrogenase (short-subunit alcohol dehydrogenase family)
MESKIILVTGSTDGIGKETAYELAKLNNTILIHGRDEQKVIATIEQIKRETGNQNLYGFTADFSRLDQVRKLAGEIIEQQPGLNVLINNAGVYMKHRALTADGYEMTFQVNHLASFLLTNLLLDLLIKNAPSRIVNVSSTTHQGAELDFNNLQGEKHYNGYEAYSTSKLANVFFTIELAEKLKGKNVTVNSLHPGAIGTKLLREGFGGGGLSVAQGAQTPVYLAVSDDVKNISGEYFSSKKIAKVSPMINNKKLREEFWQISKQLTGLKE